MPSGTRAELAEWIIGKDAIGSISEFKRVKLTTYLSIICITVSLIYTTLDTFYGVYYSYPAFAMLFIMPVGSLLLICKKRYKAAKISLLVSANLVVFWTALHDPFDTGVFLFFIPIGIGSFAILAAEESKTGIILLIFNTVLFFIAYFGDFHPFPVPALSKIYIQLSFLFNFLISLSISVLAVYFLMSLNKAAESELMKKEVLTHQKNVELQKVNSELDSFVYRVSHDLRSPLSSILGLTNLARLTSDPTELGKIHDMIEKRVHAQDMFIHEIIQYSRNARTELIIEPIKLESLIDDAIDELKYNDFADKIEFKKHLPEKAVVYTDRIRLKIILNNLLSNAIKYHDRTKKCPFIEIGFIEDNATLYVKDNGTGIQADHQGKIFNMFYRGSERSKGSGLGLFIVQESVAKLGGSIVAESVYGEGSIFKVCILKV